MLPGLPPPIPEHRPHWLVLRLGVSRGECPPGPFPDKPVWPVQAGGRSAQPPQWAERLSGWRLPWGQPPTSWGSACGTRGTPSVCGAPPGSAMDLPPVAPPGAPPSPNPAPQFSVSPSLRLATVLQNGGARGCAPGSRSGSMRSSGSTWRTSGSSPRRVLWRQRSPSVPGGGVLAEVSGRWGTAGPPRAPRCPAHSRAGGKVLPGAATQLCSPIPVAMLRLVTGPMWGWWARARRPGPAEAWVGGAGVGNGARPIPCAPPRGSGLWLLYPRVSPSTRGAPWGWGLGADTHPSPPSLSG